MEKEAIIKILKETIEKEQGDIKSFIFSYSAEKEENAISICGIHEGNCLDTMKIIAQHILKISEITGKSIDEIVQDLTFLSKLMDVVKEHK